MTTIEQTVLGKLSKDDHSMLKVIFRMSFQKSFNHNNIPFPDDAVFVARTDGKVAGFAMVHESAPYVFKFEGSDSDAKKQTYLYNLCVLPKSRCRGVGTAIVDHLKLKYGAIFTHTETRDHSASLWFAKRGFQQGKKWREIMTEFVYLNTVKEVPQPVKQTLNLRHYDPEENLIYLD